METVSKYKTVVIVAIISLLVGRYVLQPKSKVEYKERIKIVEVFKEKKEEKKKIKTTIKEHTNPDGSKDVITVITDDSSSTVQTNKDTKSDSEKSKITKTGAGLSLSLLAIKDLPNPAKAINYGVVVSVPIIGNLNATGLVTTDKQVGLGIGIAF